MLLKAPDAETLALPGPRHSNLGLVTLVGKGRGLRRLRPALQVFHDSLGIGAVLSVEA
jgi:hypothetical protein